jgi:hypothetical protein
MCCMSILIAGFLTEKWFRQSHLIKNESKETMSIDTPSISSDEDENINMLLDSLDPILNKNRNENAMSASTFTSNPLSTSNPRSSLDTSSRLTLDTASILDNLKKRVSIKLINPSELTNFHECLLQQIQNLAYSVTSTPSTIHISSINNPSKKENLLVDELFVLFKKYSSVPCWIFSGINLMIDSSKPSLADYMQEYNLDLNIKMLVVHCSSVGMLRTLLCEERITKHIELLQISKSLISSSNDLNFVVSPMQNLKTLIISKVFSELLMRLFANSYKSFMNLDILMFKTGLCVTADRREFTSPFLTVLNSVQKEVFLRRDYLQDILVYISTKEESNLTLQAKKLTLDLSSYMSYQDITMPNLKDLYYQLQKSIKILFKQNVNEYVFVASKLFLNHQNISMKKFKKLIKESYAAVKDKRQNSNIRVEYTDCIENNTKTMLFVDSNPVTD